MTLVIWVDPAHYDEAVAALPGHEVMVYDERVDLYLGSKARYFEPEWFNDPKLVEVALKRARVEKRKKVKK